jgi:hypothetical protein
LPSVTGAALSHINPAGWYRYTQFADPAINYYGVWTDGREVFVVGNDGRKTYILHGK